ncbi:HlyD family efflux transporter periplasmic adaptor subunit [Bosea sp. 2YAB26]|uniref:HlyD family efflux transporter periplasmic adaptor subunit n=1 Tax=Bosea sp. 2YAB26 TaxID=3237478 RepID=UPI003F91039F
MNREIERLDTRVPDPVESRRAGAGRIVRFIYAALVFGVLGFFIVSFGLPLIFLDGPGVVSAPRTVISPPYLVQIKRMDVGPGSVVQEGTPIAEVISPQIEVVASGLLQTLADITGREIELRVKARVSLAAIEPARARSQLAEEAFQRLERSADLGTASLIYRSDVLRERSLAVQNLVVLEAEAEEGAAQLVRLTAVRQEVRGQFDKVRREFNDGIILSPVSGIISNQTRQAGETIAAATAIAEVYLSKDIYVDWYIPDFRMIDPKPGQRVFVVFGRTRYAATLTEVLPISDQLDARRGSVFRQPDSGQIGRVRFDAGVQPPTLNSTVSVHMYYSEFTDSIARRLMWLFNLA